jgi:predicted amidophosphoribosyltransferase
MISLLCKKCGKHWYTANTMYTPKCETCGGELEKDDEDLYNKNKEVSIINNKNEASL